MTDSTCYPSETTPIDSPEAKKWFRDYYKEAYRDEYDSNFGKVVQSTTKFPGMLMDGRPEVLVNDKPRKN